MRALGVTCTALTRLSTMVRSYHGESCPSRPIREHKLRWAGLVVRWGTTCESPVLYCIARLHGTFFFLAPQLEHVGFAFAQDVQSRIPGGAAPTCHRSWPTLLLEAVVWSEHGNFGN